MGTPLTSQSGAVGALLVEAFGEINTGSQEVIDLINTFFFSSVELPVFSMLTNLQRTSLQIKLYQAVSAEIKIRLRDHMTISKVAQYIQTSVLRPWLCMCAEVVAFCEKVENLSLRTVADALGVPPYDLFRTLERFVMLNQTLTGETKQHLKHCESELVLERLWENSEGAALRLIALFGEKYPENEDDSTTPKPFETLGTPVSKAMSFFVRCLGCHVIERLKMLLEDPNLGVVNPLITENIAGVLHFCVMRKAHQLLIGRHLDTILLCAIYIVLKRRGFLTQFAHIIGCYKKLWLPSNPAVWKRINVDNKPLNIIDFYNVAFCSHVSPYVIKTIPDADGVDSSETGTVIPTSLSIAHPLAFLHAHLQYMQTAQTQQSPSRNSVLVRSNIMLSPMPPTSPLLNHNHNAMHTYVFKASPIGRSINDSMRQRQLAAEDEVARKRPRIAPPLEQHSEIPLPTTQPASE